MKKIKPTKHSTTVLNQLCKLIPSHLTAKLSRKHGNENKSRTFSAWSHVVSLLFTHLTHALSLNDVCDSLRHHASKLGAIRAATAPARNTLSHANKIRNSDMMEDVFWETYKHLRYIAPSFGPSGKYSKYPHRFKTTIHAIDSSTIGLVANCMDWAKHRRRKAAAKLHMRLNLQTFLPGFVIVEEASHHDDTRAVELCSGLEEGEIALFDKAYVNFKHLFHLNKRGVFWVLRAKDNMSYRVHRKLLKKPKDNILRDDIIFLKTKKSRKEYPKPFRRVEALIEVNGKTVKMVFITNNFVWASQSVCDLYGSRWAIEAFFKQLKQTLQLNAFLGYSKEAIRWQIWAALLLYLLLRFQAFLSKWPHSFNRILTMIRGTIWDRFDLRGLLDFYGTAGGKFRMCANPKQAYLPGFPLNNYGTANYQLAQK